jgi:hypothetical protein
MRVRVPLQKPKTVMERRFKMSSLANAHWAPKTA